ncbi:hypothetical protein [Thalassotalea agarivorans]|uniref:Thrombospondin type 3 repeat-containing protein n=1 Tax=Thalassotalea agarivorans TaxID=349064 RepID=A0A1I0GZ10_THASX|nr:hypothetical protein [Thalassotalea agarivorans]SET75788.1 hypothetical protein SAMN05660429_02613 [Thalassotalea agarivorans]
MSILLKNKVASVITATFMLASASSFANDDLFEYFPDGDLEGLTGFQTEGWGKGQLAYDAEGSIFLQRTETNENGEEVAVPAYSHVGKGWTRFVNATRTQKAGPTSIKLAEGPPEGNDTAVAFFNHARQEHGAGLAREVEGLQIGETYNLSADGYTKGTFVWAYAYSKVGAPLDENGNVEVTYVTLENTVMSDNTWVNVTDSFTVPDDIDLAHPVKVYLRTVDQEPAAIKNTEYARMWVDNMSLQGPPIPDMDEDGVSDLYDVFPTDPAASVDTDKDGMPDDYNKACDQACMDATDLVIDDDDDNDTVLDVNDGYPQDATQSVKIDLGGVFAELISGDSFTIDTSKSVPNHENATFTWAQVSGSPIEVAIENGNLVFTAPEGVQSVEQAVFELTVAGKLSTVSAQFTVDILKKPSEIMAKAALLGVAEGSTVLQSGDFVILDATETTDSEGFELNFNWASSGAPLTLTAADTSKASFMVPELNADTDVTFTVTITNNEMRHDGKSYGTEETVTLTATILKTEQEKPDSGSMGLYAFILLGLSMFVRRARKITK